MKSIPIRYFEDYDSLSNYAADLIIERIKKNPHLNLGLATGYSPALTYKIVGQKLETSEETIKSIRIVQLDEWIGPRPEDPASCHYFLIRNVVGPWQLREDQCLLLSGDRSCAQNEVEKLKSHLNSKKLDLCILGLGRNGHLALNEPGSDQEDTSRIVDLHSMSQTHPMINNHGEGIKKGLTIGLSEIMQAKEVILLVTGEEKQLPFRALMDHVATADFPVSVLLDHKNWTCLADQSSLI